ncbi:SIR2 family protein [Bacillus thuringiensis]|uniref:SIR2 family protein n=1 Tax=Bacillus thuringiensis TaxID=1428 RepID=UPI00119CE153|nr:SIR2 family protein [Bacillus thuringiensis]
MDNKLMSLSFSMEANKGVYALLLGSGVSYSANILTGWGILNELCRRIMKLHKKEHDDPIQWYKEFFGETPAYDKVIKSLADTPSERVSLLESFFEPNEHDDDNAKKPTIAHKKIAQLVKDGYIKVIVTTNFDRLMEQSLDELNIPYQTLYHDSDIEGMKPLVHANCTILKIHGDYRDTRFKNVSDELENYSEPLSNLLKQVFDEYGIITSGWSAEWDTALRDTIKSVKGRRYSWYWHAFTEKLSAPAEELLEARDGIKIINSNGADSFFSTLAENVESISKITKTRPENIQVKLSKLKKYITNDLEIELREMITEETQMLVRFIKSLDFQSYPTSDTPKEYVDIIKEKSRTLSIMLTILTYYSRNEKHESIITETLERLTTTRAHDGILTFICLSKLPAIIGLYSTGIAAVMKKNYTLLNKLFTAIEVRENLYNPEETFLDFTGASGHIATAFKEIHSEKNWLLPFQSGFMHPYMCEIYVDSKLTFDIQELNNHYDLFELLLALKHRHSYSKGFFSGMFGYKDDKLYLQKFLKFGAEEKENWQVLQLFDNSIESFTRSLERLVSELNSGFRFNGQPLLDTYQTAMKS